MSLFLPGALTVKAFERKHLLGSLLPIEGWQKPTPAQWAADRFWQSALRGKKNPHRPGGPSPALPSIAATAVAAMGGTTAPRSMTLLCGKIDPRNSPTRGDLLAKRQSIPWLEQNCMIRVAPSDAGMGRLVYPASIQKAALLAYLTRHLLAGGELFGKLMKDDGEYAAGRPFLDLFFSVADLPAEFFLETIVRVFQQFDFPRGRLIWHGEKIEPAAITRTALFTIEGAQDDVSGPGQTNVAHDLCANIPKLWRESYVQSGVGHFGLFHGAIWRSTTSRACAASSAHRTEKKRLAFHRRQANRTPHPSSRNLRSDGQGPPQALRCSLPATQLTDPLPPSGTDAARSSWRSHPVAAYRAAPECGGRAPSHTWAPPRDDSLSKPVVARGRLRR